MKTKNLFSVFFILIIFSGCALITDEYQANQRKVIAYLLEDLPLPSDADIVKAPTVLLGTGESISGRIIMTSGYSPAENLIFYGTETLSTGWQLISSKVGEEVTAKIINFEPTKKRIGLSLKALQEAPKNVEKKPSYLETLYV